MRGKVWRTGVQVLFLAMVLPATSYALSGLTVVINGVIQNVPANATSYTIANGDYGCLSIAGADGTSAKIVTDEPSDMLVLQNALMRTKTGSTTCNATLSYWATFDAPASTSTSAQKYQRAAKGTLLKNATTSSLNTWITVEGLVDGHSAGGPVTKNVTCTPPDSYCGGNFNLSVDYTFPQGFLADPHEIKFVMLFELKSSLDKLTFAGANDAHVFNSGLGGVDDTENPSVIHGHRGDGGDGCSKCCRECPDGETVKGNQKHTGKHDTKKKSGQ